MSNDTTSLIKQCFAQLKLKHGLTCELIEETLEEHYMMMFDSELNSIVFDPKGVEKHYEEGLKYGFYSKNYTLEKVILFALVHELGHYIDHKQNPDLFNKVNSKEKYIERELRGIELSRALVSPEMMNEYNAMSQLIIDSYQRDLPEE